MNVLKKYRKDVSIRQTEFAEVVGVTQSTISKIESGEINPSLELAVAIERATGGAIPPSSWVPSPEEAG
jgi:DNA-binding XRE family transcriptional regulator